MTKRKAKQPPDLFNLETEASLTGAALLAGREVLQAPTVKAVDPADFWSHDYRDTWAAILSLARKDIEPDLVTVADELQKRGQLEAVGGSAALLMMVSSCPSAMRAEGYAASVLGWARRRKVQAIISDLGAAVYKDGPFEGALREALDALTVATMAGAGPVEVRTMAEIREYFGDVAWAWPDWLPVGHLTLIAGPQSCGKSYLAARLAASFSGHMRWPDGTPLERCGFDKLPGKVLLVETEEMRGVYAERLERMGIDDHWVIFGPGDETHIPDLVTEADRVERLALQEGVAAIIVDSLSGGHELRENSAQMRRLLKRYAVMATRLHIPIILVHHANKRKELESINVTLDRVRGSSTITQFCRSVIALYRLEDGDQVSPVRVEAIKSTFGAPPDAIGFTIGNKGLTFGDAPEPVREESQLDKAEDLLLALLNDGPMLSADLQDEAEGAGISWRTMKRAKRALNVVAKREKREGEDKARWYWGLPTREVE